MQVATSTLNATLLSQSLKVQADHGEALTQQASGERSASLAGLDGRAGQTVSLRSDLDASANRVGHAQTAQSMVEVSYQAVSSIADTLAAAQSEIAAALNGAVTDTKGLKSQAEAWLATTESTLNTDFAGTPVFGGAGATGSPVTLGAADDPDTAAGETGPAYYQGSPHPRTLMIDGETRLDYGVTADAAGFDATLRGLSLLAGMATTPPDTAVLQEAYALLEDATMDMGRMLEDLSGQADSLTVLIDRETEFQLFAESALESVESVDLAEAAARVSELEVVLEASYAALASLTTISLHDYLR